MPKFIIERDIAGVGDFARAQLQVMAQHSCHVLSELGPQIQWLESIVTQDKIYCAYIAPSEALVREHARRGGFPVDRVCEVRGVIDPTTAELSTAG